MKINSITKLVSGTFIMLFPLMVSCSVIGGNSYSDNPAVAAQQKQVESLKLELREAERLAEEAELREKAAKDRLKAAENELKVLKSQAKANGY